MLNTTVSRLHCPACASALSVFPERIWEGGSNTQAQVFEITTGLIRCERCHAEFPILCGIALLVPDPQSYLLEHVKGIAGLVPDEDIPEDLRSDYLDAKAELSSEHIEEDLESERVVSLYLANHYLDTRQRWWKSEGESPSQDRELIDTLIETYWGQGPLRKISDWVSSANVGDALDLGCGVGGISRVLNSKSCHSYLGVDFSFASIALGRHLVLGVPYPKAKRIPSDLLHGAVSREVEISVPGAFDGTRDLIVADIDSLPLTPESFDSVFAMNIHDMVPNPEEFPKTQFSLLRRGGMAVQSCPYVWHPETAKFLREILPAEVSRHSASAAEWLFRSAGFEIEEAIPHLPWLFYKHQRQLEIYSVHLFRARKPS